MNLRLERSNSTPPARRPAHAEETEQPAPLLTMRSIGKSFGGVPVLKDVSFDVRAGEVHALCGENGAGKSTLMNILAGVHQPESGRILFDGREYSAFPSAHAAQQLGIAIVFQERSLFGPLTVAENVFAGRQPVRSLGRVDRCALFAETRALLVEVGLAVKPDTPLEELSSAAQQM